MFIDESVLIFLPLTFYIALLNYSLFFEKNDGIITCFELGWGKRELE